MNDFLTRRRWGTGSLLLLAVLFLLLVPLWQTRGITHPLASEVGIDLCARLPALPPALADLKMDAPKPNICEWRDADRYVQAVVLLSTTRSMSAGGGMADTEKMYATWVKESRATYGPGTELTISSKEGWRHAYAYAAGGDKRGLIFEDHGVMLQFEFARLDAASLERYAAQVQQTLRKK